MRMMSERSTKDERHAFDGSGEDTFGFPRHNERADASDWTDHYQSSRSGRRFSIDGDRIRITADGINTFDDLMATAQQQEGGVLFALGDGEDLFMADTQLSALDKDSFTFF